MGREIKFRAWDGREMIEPYSVKSGKAFVIKPCNTNDKVLEDSDGVHYYSNWDIDVPTDYPLMQYTGLEDKDGVEIYEGDVVRILYTDWASQSGDAMSLEDYKDSKSHIGKIVFQNCRFCIQFNDDGYTDSIHCGTHGQIKVIGDIHQNPELLTTPEVSK